MKISIYGSGYVGLVTALCFSEIGHEVVCQDINPEKIVQLQQGHVPLFEPGLDQLLQKNLAAERVVFTNDAPMAYQHGMLHFIAVGTPSDEDGSADLSHVIAVAKGIAAQIQHAPTVVIKSTVPIGSGTIVAAAMQQVFAERGVDFQAQLVSNPEFLREGSAVKDFLIPDRVVIGGDNKAAVDLVKNCYLPFVDEQKIICMTRAAAEMTKYAANAMLATKISFINELSRLAEKTGIDILDVKKGIALDHRIGPHFIQPGCGYGGSCFPKDIAALSTMAKQWECDMPMLTAVSAVNARQKLWPVEKLNAHYDHHLAGKVIAIWGLSFKPDTDDMREASSISVINTLLKAGAHIQVYDPEAYSQAKKLWTDKEIVFANSAEEAIEGANALLLLTEWACFKEVSLSEIKKNLQDALIIDGRNLFDIDAVKQAGFMYQGVGRN